MCIILLRTSVCARILQVVCLCVRAPVCMPVCVLVCDIKKCFEYTYILICLSYLSSLHTFPHAYLYMKQSYANLYI
jgi:hypothetical protein